MTDKEKFRKEVEKLKSQLLRGACSSQIAMETRCKEEAYNEVLSVLDTMQEEHVNRTTADVESAMQEVEEKSRVFTEVHKGEDADTILAQMRGEEPVSEELEKVVEEIVDPTVLNAYGTKELARRLRNTICGTSVSNDLGEAARKYFKSLKDDCFISSDIMLAFKAGAKWQKAKDKSVTNDLGEYINELSKQFPEVSFAKLSRIAVRVANWQKQQDQETIETAIHHAYHNGRLEMKDEMMEKAIEGEVITTSDYGWENIRVHKKEHHCGQKLKVIVVKED